MDCTLKLFDVRPFAPQNRCIKVFPGTGAEHSYEKNLLKCAMTKEGTRVTSGSADTQVRIWSIDSFHNPHAPPVLLYCLPGHKGSVNEVQFHPKQPIIASCSSDKTIFLGEIQPASF